LETSNRKSFRPPLAELKERSPQSARAAAAQKKQTPPDQTNAENFYYVKQMQSKTPMVLVLKDGEEIHGVIEWYDKGCLKVNRDEGPNLLVYKSYVKYMYKA
jgi:host factor-I protein